MALTVRSTGTVPQTVGTGFFIAPGMVATCAHVVADSAESLPEVVHGQVGTDGRAVRLRPVLEHYFRDPRVGFDLALLQLVPDENPIDDVGPWVLFDGGLVDGDNVWAWGHPDGMFRGGQSVELAYQGPSRRDSAGPGVLSRLWGPPVGPGYSGSAVLNKRTGAVAGMLCTSDHSGSAHALSASALLSRCPQRVRDLHAAAARAVSSRLPQAQQPWFETLTDEQLRDGEWAFPSRRLRTYLDAAQRAAESHPYPGVVPGNVSPPLSTVYVSQHARSLGAGPGPEVADAERLQAGDVIEHHMDALVTGGPGAGKSSLLRSLVRECVARWRVDGTLDAPHRTVRRAPMLVPIYVQASDLVEDRPLAQALEAAARADAGRYSPLGIWPVEFFRERPSAQASWLVLVDGLDELVSRDQREIVLTRLAGIRNADPEAATYRCVLATRPVPELLSPGSAHWHAATFDLLPFDSLQLREFAARWLNALGLPEPEQAAEQFTLQFGERHREALVRVPLMATMLCQLFADQPKPPLPTARHEVYRSFVSLLQSRQYSDAPTGIIAQARTAAARYGVAAVSAAERLPSQVVDLASEFALTWLDGQNSTALEYFTSRTQELRPSDLPEDVWRAILRETMRRSGLFTERGGDLVFIHQTLLEFLAARQLARDPERVGDALRGLFGRWGRRLPPEWRQHDSFTRFLIAVVGEHPLLTKALWRCGTSWQGALFVAGLVQDGLPVTQRVVRRSADTLAATADKPECTGFFRRELAYHLRGLGDDRDADILFAVATDHMVSDNDRIMAARALRALRDTRYPEALLSLAADPEAGPLDRQSAMQQILDGLPDAALARRLVNVVADPVFHTGARKRLLQALKSANPAGYAELLVSCAQDAELSLNAKALATRGLAEAGDPRAPGLLLALAGEQGVDRALRYELMRTLQSIDANRYTELLVSYGENSDLDFAIRATALGELADAGDTRAADMLVRLADTMDADSSEDERTHPLRLRVAQRLAVLHDTRAGGLLTALARDVSAGASIRLRAAHELKNAGHPQATDVFASLAEDPRLDEHARVSAARALADAEPAGSPRLSTILVRLVTEPDMGETAREEAFFLLDVYVETIADPNGHASGSPEADHVFRILTEMADNQGHSHRERVLAAATMQALQTLRRQSRSQSAKGSQGPLTAFHTRTRLPRLP
ncbi:trypsin-like peptidase domain-containing protein, partial [Streptomyces sp. NPDC087859]|uniref:trypsin-like peptidase domain-containing protein n=1 Tax=Streptomyces sp. NPDC087859 TaxID=3365812 RepID=UPI003821CFFF